MIIENKSYDDILAEIVAKMPPEITLLESDPAAKILEIVAFREMILRERINNAAKANLLAFAAGSDLDYLAEFYGVERQESEPDEQFRTRIKARIAAFSNAGSKEHYRFHALSSSQHVKDALASTPGNGVVKTDWTSPRFSTTSSPLTQNVYTGSGAVAAVVSKSTETVVNSTTETTNQLLSTRLVEGEFMRPATQSFRLAGFLPGEHLRLVFDGIELELEPTSEVSDA